MKRTKRLAGRVSEAEHAEIMGFLRRSGLSLTDFVLMAVRSGSFKICPICGAVEGDYGCPNRRAPYPAVKQRAEVVEEFERGGEYWLIADGKIYHWDEDDI